MRLHRLILALAVTTALLATPALALAQPADGTGPETLPLARQPAGLLPLEGTPWRLTWYRWKGTERTPGPEVAARMTLSAGELEASGGCTGFKGSYGTTGNVIDFKLKRLKENDCGEQTTMVQLAMVDGLRDATWYELDAVEDGDRLTFFDDGVESLRFGLDDVNSFAGTFARTEWWLTAYTVEGIRYEPDPEATPNLVFVPQKRNSARRRSSGEVLSSTGCNGFVGQFYGQANVMSFGQLSVTDAPCSPTMTRQQDAILGVFDATAIGIAFPPDRLIMTSRDDGSELEYRAVPALEGSTWIASATRAGSEGERVTIRLASGTATGEGPCGPYSATYVTDGVFLTFSDLRGADDGSCSTGRAEKRLLSALQAAVRVDRHAGKDPILPRLTLRDARGSEVARFEYPFGGAP